MPLPDVLATLSSSDGRKSIHVHDAVYKSIRFFGKFRRRKSS